MGKAVVEAQFEAPPNNLSLGESQQGGVDLHPNLPLYPCLCSQGGHSFEGFEIFGTAIGITAVVNGVGTDEDVAGAQYLGPGQGKGEEDGVAGRNIRGWDAAGN